MPTPILTYTIAGKTTQADSKTKGLEDIAIVPKLESGQFFYRLFWEGEITFVGADYTTLWELHKVSCCERITITLYRAGARCEETELYWSGTFNLSQIEFNASRCEAKLAEVPKPDDGYQTLLENWNREFNWMDLEPSVQLFTDADGRKHVRGRFLSSFLVWLTWMTVKDTKAATIYPNINTYGTFFTAKINPVTQSYNYCRDLVCIQASDYATPNVPVYAIRHAITLKKVVEDLSKLFRVFPHIDPFLGTLRWEHESYYPQLGYRAPEPGLSFPATSPVWLTNPKVIRTETESLVGLCKLTIDANKTLGGEDFVFGIKATNDVPITTTPKKEYKPGVGGMKPRDQGSNEQYNDQFDPRLAANQATPIDMQQGTIEFADACITRREGEEPITDDRTVTIFATDTYAARIFPDRINRESWIFLVALNPSTVVGPGRVEIPVFHYKRAIANVETEISRRVAENGYLAASGLIRDFHRHRQPFGDGIMNKHALLLPAGVHRVMRSVIPNRIIEEFTIEHCCDDESIDFRKSIETWYGAGAELRSLRYRVAKDQIVMSVAHAGPCQLPEPGEYDPDGPLTDCKPYGTIKELIQRVENGINETYAVVWNGKCGTFEQKLMRRQNSRP